MKKEDCLYNLENLIKWHNSSMKNIYLLIHGEKIDDKLPPTDYNSCKTTNFLQSSLAKQVLSPQSFEKIEKTHILWHEIFQKIYDIYFNSEKSSFLKIFSKNKLSLMEKDKIRAYYDELEKTSKEYINLLEIAKKRVQAMDSSKFSNL